MNDDLASQLVVERGLLEMLFEQDEACVWPWPRTLPMPKHSQIESFASIVQ